jgi:hypothetical protein
VRDEKFRIDFRKAAKSQQKKYKKTGFDVLLRDGRSKPNPIDYTVVYGINAYKKTGKVGLPFFIKVTFRSIAERIQLMAPKREQRRLVSRGGRTHGQALTMRP